MRALKHVAIWHNVTPTLFRNEIAPLAEPAILKGLVNDWPIVKKAKKDEKITPAQLPAWLEYLSSLYVGGDVRMAEIKTSANPHFSYNEALNGFNFNRKIASYAHFLQLLCTNAQSIEQNNQAGAVAIQSAPVADYFNEFVPQHSMALFSDNPQPRFWLGNQSTVVAHYDDAENIACVVAGKRKVTLFPPHQIANLYIGSLEHTPAGAPVSMVNLDDPDFIKFPKFKEALNDALIAELEPGDALFIPTLWWHHVEALSGINMLVNYWSGGSITHTDEPVPMDAMLLTILTIRDLPKAQKKAWQAFFNYQVFDYDPVQNQHIPDQFKGILNSLTDQQRVQVKQWLIKQLS
jgi:hypothetical protein